MTQAHAQSDVVAGSQAATGTSSEASRLSSGFDSVVQAGMMYLQGNVMKATNKVASRYYDIAKKDDNIWTSLYKPVMSSLALEVYALPVRPQDNAFFRSRNLVPQSKGQLDWYNARLRSSRYAQGAREDMDYRADLAVREARTGSAFFGISTAEAYFERYKEQRRVHWAKIVALGRGIQSNSMNMLSQAADMQKTAAVSTMTSLGGLGGAVRQGLVDFSSDSNMLREENRLSLNVGGPTSASGIIKEGLGMAPASQTNSAQSSKGSP